MGQNAKKFGDILADFSGLGQYLLKPIFALKPWAEADDFEYHKGSHRYLRGQPSLANHPQIFGEK